MRISKNSYLAVECLALLAARNDKGPCTAGTLARGIVRSDAYMEDILARLRAAGLVRAIRGPGGGYMLSRAADAISVAEILAAMGDQAGRHGVTASRSTELGTDAGELWRRLGDHVRGYLETVLLSDLMPRSQARQGGVP